MPQFKVKYKIPGSSQFHTRVLESNSAAEARRLLKASVPSATILSTS